MAVRNRRKSTPKAAPKKAAKKVAKSASKKPVKMAAKKPATSGTGLPKPSTKPWGQAGKALEGRDPELAEQLAREHTLGLAAHVEQHGDFLDTAQDERGI